MGSTLSLADIYATPLVHACRCARPCMPLDERCVCLLVVVRRIMHSGMYVY
jgi:hypothetical protein